MKPLKDDIKDKLANKFGLESTELVFQAGGGREESNGDTLLIATLMEFIEGSNPNVNELQSNTKLIYKWGKLTGKMHKAAKKYLIWKNVCESDERFGFEAEIEAFIKMSPNDFIRGKWMEMKDRLKALPINRDTYGFIHFLKGYRTENEIDEFWLGQFGVFLECHRLLLYTVMQGWLSNDKEADEEFLNMT